MKKLDKQTGLIIGAIIAVLGSGALINTFLPGPLGDILFIAVPGFIMTGAYFLSGHWAKKARIENDKKKYKLIVAKDPSELTDKDKKFVAEYKKKYKLG